MPLVKVKSGKQNLDGTEESLSEYQCDGPNCPNVGNQVIGVSFELRAALVLCEEHAAIHAGTAEVAQRGFVAPEKTPDGAVEECVISIVLHPRATNDQAARRP